MNKTSTGQNINLAFYQSIEKAIEVGNQLVLDSVLMSDKILTPEQKFELLMPWEVGTPYLNVTIFF